MEHRKLLVDQIPFIFVCDISPDRGPDGRILEFMPQERYKGAGLSRLNPHGHGPFCRFRFSREFPFPGVYAVTVSDRITYIGECVSLSNRWGLGQYGSIQPKNCYVGGQSTNCKINSRVLVSCRAGHRVQLWFHRTGNHKSVEQALRAKLRPEWNGQF